MEGDYLMYTLYAAGDDVAFKTNCHLFEFEGIWYDLTKYAKPIIRHIRLYDGLKHVDHGYWSFDDDTPPVALLMVNAQTVEVGLNYPLGWKGFWEDLKQLGTQLKTIRFEVSEDTAPCDGNDCTNDNCYLCHIEELVKYQFEQGRPFSAVERMVVSENDRVNRSEAYVWRLFYGVRKISQYVLPVQTI